MVPKDVDLALALMELETMLCTVLLAAICIILEEDLPQLPWHLGAWTCIYERTKLLTLSKD